MKSDFQYSQGIVQMDWGPSRSVIILVGSEAEIISNIGDLRNKYFNKLSNFELKITLVQFHEKWLSV